MTRALRTAVLALLFLGVLGCGGLRYSQVSPEAKDFHPQRIAVLPADTLAFGEAKADIDRLVAEVLEEKKWFAAVTGGEAIGRRLETDAELRQAATEYLSKRDKLNFSDPELSGRIGTLTRTEALLLVRVHYWNYTTQDDNKVAKISLGITMIEAKTGKTVWTATHQRVSDYLLIKPDLPDVAKGLLREMIGYMPH
jgi:hypothetical protein